MPVFTSVCQQFARTEYLGFRLLGIRTRLSQFYLNLSTLIGSLVDFLCRFNTTCYESSIPRFIGCLSFCTVVGITIGLGATGKMKTAAFVLDSYLFRGILIIVEPKVTIEI